MSVGGIMVKQILLVALALLLAACSQVAQPALVDNRPPSVVITGPGEGQVMAPNMVVRAVASSSRRIASVTYSLDSGVARTVGTQSQIEIPLQSLSNGTHQVRLTVRDEGGLETTVTRTFVVDSASQPDVDFAVNFAPTALGFFRTPAQTIEWIQHTVTFTNKVGALPVVIEGYRIEFMNGAGAPMFGEGNSELFGRGSLSISLPAEPQPVVLENLVDLPTAVITYVENFNEVGTHAHIYFNGTDVFGVPFVQGPFEVAIVYPASQ